MSHVGPNCSWARQGATRRARSMPSRALHDVEDGHISSTGFGAVAGLPGTGMMRAKFIAAAILPLALLLAPGRASGNDPTPAGLWQALDGDTKEPTGWFIISNHNGVYDGIIARMFFKPGEDPNVVCGQCNDDRHDHPWLGLEIIRGMKPEGADKFGGGTILDPRDGKIYHATMKISPDGQT